MPSKKNYSTRATSALILSQVLFQQSTFPDAVEKTTNGLEDKRDRAFLQALCYGVLRHLAHLEFYLGCLLKKPLKTHDGDIHALLLIGLYQHLHMRVPPHAATAETVQATRFLKKPWASRLVNGVLRSFIRQEKELLARLQQQSLKDLELRWLHPRWFIEQLQQDFTGNTTFP